jgi:vacuolar-type H+-ATPase subunit E/Vma4
MQWLQLDLQFTFNFAPRFPRGTQEHERAEYTIDVLKLNDRQELQRARRRAYENYRARLHEYIVHLDSQSPQSKLKSLRNGLKQESHPTVWAEMKRQHSVIKELYDLFSQAPEALNW